MRSKVCSDVPFADKSLNPPPERLQYSKFNTPEDLATFSQRFDEGLKKVFSISNSHMSQFVKFGSLRDNDPSYGIKDGKLRLTG